jgi:hypothetical protein
VRVIQALGAQHLSCEISSRAASRVCLCVCVCVCVCVIYISQCFFDHPLMMIYACSFPKASAPTTGTSGRARGATGTCSPESCGGTGILGSWPGIPRCWAARSVARKCACAVLSSCKLSCVHRHDGASGKSFVGCARARLGKCWHASRTTHGSDRRNVPLFRATRHLHVSRSLALRMCAPPTDGTPDT